MTDLSLDDDIDPAISQPLVSVSPWPTPTPMFTYLAGAAGSGKTFLIKAWMEEEKGILLCASTGIAAVNLGGCATINATLGYFDTKSLQDAFVDGRLTARLGRLWKSGVRRLVLDEVSMTEADQITYLVRAIEEVNGRGYVLDKQSEDTPADMGLTLVGDMLQLGPVKAAYAFESPEWGKFAEHTHTLTEIKRQADPDFIEALRHARSGHGAKALEYFAQFLHEHTDDQFDGPTILAKNEAVDRYNHIRFDRISTPTLLYPSARWGKQRSEWGNPEKPAHTWGIPERLPMKVGALVMILTNVWGEGSPTQRRAIYVNGDLGEVTETPDPKEKYIRVRLQRTGQEVSVDYVHRDVLIPCDSARRKELRDQGKAQLIGEGGKWEITGGIDYLPVRLAYACTTFKSQGLSLDKVQVSLRDPFFKTSGMTYVALSRARSPQGLRIVGSAATLVDRCVCDPKLKPYL